MIKHKDILPRLFNAWWWRVAVWWPIKLWFWRIIYRGFLPYVVIWERQQVYGGPEEGGWWFWQGIPIVHKRMPFFLVGIQAHYYKRSCKEVYEAEFGTPAFNVDATTWGDVFSVTVDRQYPEAYPKERPHYE